METNVAARDPTRMEPLAGGLNERHQKGLSGLRIDSIA